MANLFLDLFNELGLIRIFKALAASSSSPVFSPPIAGQPERSQTDSSSRPFSEIIKEASQAYGIDEDVIKAVIQQESSFNPQAVSSCGALGLMQLMPATAQSLGVADPFNAEENIMAGTRYLRDKLDEFNGNLALALAAYNAGSGAVRKYGGVPPYKETQAYVNKIIKSIDHRA